MTNRKSSEQHMTAREAQEFFSTRKTSDEAAVADEPKPIADELNRISGHIVDAAYAVHSHLGPGLLESVYEVCLVHELTKRGLAVARQVDVPVEYDGIKIDSALRVDLIVEKSVLVELKAVESLLAVHAAQVLTYLKLTGCRLGLLINFNVPLIRDGIKRLVR